MSLISNSRLLNLIETGQNVKEIKVMIAEEELHNVSIDDSNNKLLHFAVEHNNVNIVKYLVNSGSQVDAQNNLGKTALMLALGNVKMVKILLKARANIYMCDRNGRSPLQILGQWVWEECNVSDRETRERYDTLLRVLRLFFQIVKIDCLNNNEEIVKKLSSAGWTLPKVVLLKKVDLTNMMLCCGSDVNAIDVDGLTALHEAIRLADIENITVLLEHKADVNAVDSKQRRPLAYMYHRYGHSNTTLEMIKMLIEKGANKKICEAEDTDTYEYLYLNMNVETMELLLQNDLIDLHINDPLHGDTVIHLVAPNRHPGVIEFLCSKNLDVNVFNGEGDTPLMIAATWGSPNTVKSLLEAGADIDAADSLRETALSKCISQRCFWEESVMECVQILLESGANVQVEFYGGDDDNETILDEVVARKEFLSGELVLSRLALQESLGTPLTNSIYRSIDSHEQLKSYFDFSKQQLSMKIHQSITMFDLLTDSDRKWERYARCEELILKLKETFDGKCNCSYFDSILQKRLLKATQMVDLKDRAAQVISNFMEVDYSSAYFIVGDIVSFLNEQEMLNLLDIEL